jgi:hypothetical protein
MRRSLAMTSFRCLISLSQLSQRLLQCAQLNLLRDDKGLQRLFDLVYLDLMRVACASPWQGVCHKYFVAIDQSGCAGRLLSRASKAALASDNRAAGRLGPDKAAPPNRF